MTAEQNADGPLALVIEACPILSLAMFENAIPVVSRVSVTNVTTEPIENVILEVELTQGLSQVWTAHISSIPPDSTFNVTDIDLPLERDKLVNQLERGAAEIVVRVRAEGQDAPLVSTKGRIEVLAYNEWIALGLQQLLAAFVLPNHPVIAELLAAARAPLQELTGDPALDGYQSRSPKRVQAIAEAIYRTIQSRGITYSNPPASFEKVGQKIRTPEQIIQQQVATCLDVSVLVAAALEQAGLQPVVVLVRGHAFPGVWLEEYPAADGVIDDVAAVRKLVGLGRLMVFDSSATVVRPAKSFADARRTGEQILETAQFNCLLDIAGARLEGFRPLPSRSGPGYAAVVEVPVQVPKSGPSGIPIAAASESSGGRTKSARSRHPRVDGWKQRLLDTTLRNRLLNFKDTKQSLELLCEEPATVEDLLASGRELAIRSRPPLLGGDDPRSRKLLDTRLADDAVKSYLRERLARGELHTTQPTDTTDSKLVHIFRAAREALEETGTNMLCLTIGMLHWFESDTSEEARRAPILLVPVSLHRNARTSGYTLKSTGEDARLNVTLFEKIRIDRGITLPELSELPLDEAGVDVHAILTKVREAVLNVRRWEVRSEVHLGLFSFAKFQMWADLDQNLDLLLQNPVLQHILNGKRDTFPNAGPFPEPSELDAKYSPKDLLCPLDADSSQLAAVGAAAEGRTFVLQGPPGTGKSQTITNLITHCIAQGKRVLFVAEKAAALEVVQRRLAQVGLGPYVLELHSHKSGKLQVLEQFRAALEAQPASLPTSWESDARRLLEERQYLNAYVAALHRRGPNGFSIFQALGQLDSLRDVPRYVLPATCAETAERFEVLLRQTDELVESLEIIGPVAQSPWSGCVLPGWRVDLPSQVAQAIEKSQSALDASSRSASALASALGANPPTTLTDVDALCAVATALAKAPAHGPALERSSDFASTEQDGRALLEVVRTRSQALTRLNQTYAQALFGLDLANLASTFRRHAHSFVLFAWWGLRHARKMLKEVVREGRLPSRRQIADDLEHALATREQEAVIAQRDTRAREIFGAAWRGTDTEPAELENALGWARDCRAAFAALRPGLLPAGHPKADAGGIAAEAQRHLHELRQALADLDALLGRSPPQSVDVGDEWEQTRTRLGNWRRDLHKLRGWYGYLTASRGLAEAGCSPIVDAASDGTLAPELVARAFRKGVYDAWVRQALNHDPVLCAFDSNTHRKHIDMFTELDRKVLGTVQTVARAQLASRAPVTGAAAAGGEVGVIQKELQKKRGHLPIRKLLAQVPAVASRLKPCFLMSPMSVATYLDPKAPPFDIVVFDEASQIPAHDAVGALARGKSAVVVGDTNQLPPTTFFQSSDDEPVDDNEFEELESVLNECIASGIPERRLDWHYRSRHETLIAFSNHAYYKNRLNTFPSSMERGEGRGVTLKRVSGFYDKGGSRTNRAEALALVNDLLARLRAPGASKRTYGVVTFSQAQQQLIDDLLEQARAKEPALEPFFDDENNPEYVIVKNLENIQGDERDVMLFSICYGPDQTDKVSMNFGPLNRDGGERRLNVAVTRAREELVVYSTLPPEKIDLTRTKARGVKDLKLFLDYAARGPRAIAEALTLDGQDEFDSPFEQQVCERLRALGFKVHTQVGCAGYRLDLGLADPDEPGRYVLAVECDGAHYHSARSARERDRLRAQVLAGLGWRIHRIWSTDWWQDPNREIEKVKSAFDRARIERQQGLRETTSAHDVATAAPSVASTGRLPGLPPQLPTPEKRLQRVSVPPTRTEAPAAPQYARLTQVDSAAGIQVYEVATVPVSSRSPDDVHDERYRDETRQVLLDIVRVEAPLSLRTLSKRVAPYFGIQRATSRLDERLRSILGRVVRIENEIVWRLDQDPTTYTDYREAPADGRRDASEVPPEEVANAAAAVLRGSISVDHDELVKLTARLLGYSRTGGKVAEQMTTGIALLLKRGTAKRDGEKIVLL